MKTVHKPVRECISCGKKFCKSEMLRIVKNDSGIYLDPAGKEQGRGAYLCNNPSCREKMVKTRRLDRAFRGRVDQTVYEAVLSQCETGSTEPCSTDR